MGASQPIRDAEMREYVVCHSKPSHSTDSNPAMTTLSFTFRSAVPALLLWSVSAFAAPAADEANAAFMHLADDYFDQYYFPTNPTAATPTGLHQYDDKLEDYSRAAIDKQIATLKDWKSASPRSTRKRSTCRRAAIAICCSTASTAHC